MRLLEFMFIDVWHFAGCFAILLVIASILARRPNVTNLYEVPAEYWKKIGEQPGEDNGASEQTDEEAAKQMWKRDV